MGKLTGAAAALALSLVVTSCSSGGGGSTEPDPAPAAAPIGSDITVDELVGDLAAVGIRTYADEAADRPEVEPAAGGVAKVTQWQAENMTRQLSTGRGYIGRDLDALVGGEVPISVVLAAYVSAGATPGARLARELMGERDWAHSALDVVYPDVVLTLFANDLAAEGGAPKARPGVLLVQPAAYPAASAGLCSQVSDFLSSTLDAIVNGLKIEAQGGVAGVLASIWNTVVDIAATAAELALSALTAPVVAAIKTAVSVLAVLSSASSVLDPWAVEVSADSNPTSYGVDPAPGKEVVVTAAVTSKLKFSWPDPLVDCATVAGVSLPNPGDPKGSPVAWKVQHPGVVTEGQQDATLDDGGRAQLHLTTLTESQEDHDEGDLILSYVDVSATVTRLAVEELSQMLQKVVLSALPEAVAGIVAKLLGPLAGEATDKLAKLVDASGKASSVEVQHHGPAPDDETPSAAPTDECEVIEGVSALPDGTYEGPLDLDVRGSVSDSGISVDSDGGGQMTIVVEKGKVTGGSWKLSWRSSGGGTDNDVKVHVELDGQIAGQMTGTADAPVAQGSWSINGKATATAMGITQDVPIKEGGSDASTLTVEATSCDDITATFIPSFNSKTQGVAVIEGVARWTGTRVE